jgi:hypothetical protein
MIYGSHQLATKTADPTLPTGEAALALRVPLQLFQLAILAYDQVQQWAK